MTHRRPEDDDIIDAQVEGEVPPRGSARGEPAPGRPEPPAAPPPPVEPPAAPGPFVGRHAARPKKGSGIGIVVLMLIAIAGVAVIFRREVTDLYDRLTGQPKQDTAPAPARTEGDNTPGRVRPTARGTEAPRKETGPEIPNYVVPEFEKRTMEEVPKDTGAPPPETPAPPFKEPYPGLAYSIIKTEDVGYEGVKQYEFKVVVPAGYKEEDLLRMAANIVASQRRLGDRHAIRILCFTDPEKTKPEQLFAQVDWAPEGDFTKAADAVNKGVDKNTYRVTMKK